MKERILPKGHPDTATSRNTEAEILHLMGREEEALELNAQVLSTFIAAYGPASGEAAYIFSNRGDYLMALARPAEALAQYRVGLTRWEPHIGHDNPFLAYPLTGMGRALVALGRPKEAIPPLERALALRDPKESDPTDVAETQFGLAQALRDAGANARRARSLATASRDAYRHAGREKEARAVDEWLSR
jgi:tetratricopeptide (TPR) repeat protein